MARTYLKIPYRERDKAKWNGARWDPDFHKWYLNGVTSREEAPDSLRPYVETSLDAPDVIYVGLYGGKAASDPTYPGPATMARTVACERHETCPLFAQGRCAAVVAPKSGSCPHARHGLITKSNKDSDFEERIRSLSTYAALDPVPSPHFVIVADDIALMHTGMVEIELDPGHEADRRMFPPRRMRSDDDIAISTYGTWDGDATLPLSRLTPEVLHELVNARPTDARHHTIKEYRQRTVPRMLAEMADNWPEGYTAYARKYPSDVLMQSNVGRIAYLRTCAQGATFEHQGNAWTLDGTDLVCDDYDHGHISTPIATLSPKGTKVRMPIAKTATIEVTDNSQTCETTTFM